jgi:hypothetical protein
MTYCPGREINVLYVADFIPFPLLSSCRYPSPLIRSSGTASRNPAVMTQMRERLGRLEAQAAEFTKVQLMLEKLKTSPEDAEANTMVGKYRVFVRGDFETGLPMLAKGSDPALKAIAIAEQKNPTTAEAQKALADQWWDLAGKVPVAADVCKARAANWYGKAEPNLTGLAKGFVKQRMSSLIQKDLPEPQDTGGESVVIQIDNDKAELKGDWVGSRYTTGYIGMSFRTSA